MGWYEKPSLSGISSLRSDIPARLRRGIAKRIKKSAFKLA